jgi:hypothetical protein
MTRLRGSWTATAAVTLFLLSACAQTDGVGAAGESASPGPSAGGSAPASADQLVLRVEQGGGIAGNRGQATKLPQVSVYADGRVISVGPTTAIYPGPALPNLQVRTVAPATVDELVAQGKALAGAGDLGRPAIADGTTTTITVQGRKIIVYALHEAQPSDSSLTPAQQEARRKVLAFAEQLTGLPAAADLPAPVSYVPQSVAAIAQPWTKATQDLVSDPPVTPWIGPALPGEAVPGGNQQGCVTVTGDDAAKLLTAAKTANQNTPWKSGTETWRVTFRPLLPDESGCADLQAKR